VDHVRSEWYVTGTSVTWDFRGGSRVTCQGKSRGDGWDRYRNGSAIDLFGYYTVTNIRSGDTSDPPVFQGGPL